MPIDIAAIPFNTLLGITADEDSGSVCLQCTAKHLNHLGAAHAGVIFTVAESASARFLIENFPDLEDKVVAVVRSVSGKYRKPATGLLRGIGHVPADEAAVFVQRLEQRKRAELEVGVTVYEEQEQVFVGSFRWFASVVDG